MTPQRLCILQALVESNSQPSAEDVYAQVQRVSVICTRCGQIEDVQLQDLSGLQTGAGQALGYRISVQRVEFYGLCRACQEAPEQKEKVK